MAERTFPGGWHQGGDGAGWLWQEDPERGKELFSAEVGYFMILGFFDCPPPSAPFTRQKADLVHRGHFAHTDLPGCEVDVFRGYRAGHGEVLENGGEKEE